ncbi:MAG TPA: hypothetical protein PKC30_01850 [Saprospiraceae bacterium]|nr:hypothetical protein [Saprospiraceae bacterium]
MVSENPFYPIGLPLPHIIHGVILTVWYIFLVIQTRWITVNKFSIHKSMGRFGAALALLVVLSTEWVIYLLPSRPAKLAKDINSTVKEIEPDLVQILWLDIFMNILFIAFISIAILQWKTAHVHKRLMLYSGIVFLFASVFRLGEKVGNLFNHPVVGFLTVFVILFLFTSSLLLHDYQKHKKIYPLSWMCFGLYWLCMVMSFVLQSSGFGTSFLHNWY